MKKLIIKILCGLVILGVIGLVVLYFSMGSIVKKGVETVGPMVTKVDVKLDSATVSPFSGGGGLKGLVMGNPEGFKTKSAVNVGEVSVAVVPSSIFKDKVIVSYVRVISPEITYEKGLKSSNFDTILENVNAFAASAGGANKGSEPSKGASRKLQVNEITITGTKMNVSLTMMGGKAVTVPLPDIKLTDLGTGPDGITAAELIQKVMSSVTTEAAKAAAGAVANLGKDATDAVKNLGESGGDAAKKTTEGIKSLFKKK